MSFNMLRKTRLASRATNQDVNIGGRQVNHNFIDTMLPEVA